MDIILIQIGLGICLFFIINWIGKHSFSLGYVEITLFVTNEESPALNFLIRVLSPLVYLLITAALLYAIHLDKFVNNFYWVNIYYIIFRLLFNLITQRTLLLNWVKQIIYWIAIISLSVIIYDKIIRFKHNLLPDFSSIANELWIIIIVFIFQLLNGLKLSNKGIEKRKDAYLKYKFQHFKKLYGSIIRDNTKIEGLEIIAYAILIYEDFNRPKIARRIEYIRFFFTKKHHSLGVMQFPTSRRINDLQSVELGTKKIFQAYTNIIKKNKENPKLYESEFPITFEIISNYNGGSKYYNEVSGLSENIKSLFYPNSDNSLFPLKP